MIRIIFLSALLMLGSKAFAEQKVVDGEYQIHYSVFPSTAISPEVAANYELRRSDYRALVNITPQKTLNGETKGLRAAVTGTARNLIGNTKKLEFREFIEQDSVYYIAEFSFSNEEHFRFDINVQPHDQESRNINLKFEKKFFRE